MKLEIDSSDLDRIADAMAAALRYHRHRDAMNAELHLASETRYSPLTSELEGAQERIARIRAQGQEPTVQ